MTPSGEPIALLEGMLEIPSVTGREAPLAEWLVGRLAAQGFEAGLDPAGNLIAGWGGGGGEVVLLGHLDTVAGEIPVRREGDRLYGRGSVDAKGPLAAALTAVARQPRDRRRFTVIGAVEEEGSSRGARHLLDRRAPEQLIVLEPSGWEGITLGYKGSLRLQYRLTQPAGHGAGRLPSAGDKAVEFIRRVQDHAAGLNRDRSLFERLDVRVLGLTAVGDGLVEEATATLGLRLPPGTDPGRLMAELGAWSEDAVLECRGSEPPVRSEKSTPLARGFVRAIRAHGGEPRFKLKTGTSDMNILAPAWGCPSVAYGPGDSALDHTPDEHVDVGEWARGVEVLDTVLASL